MKAIRRRNERRHKYLVKLDEHDMEMFQDALYVYMHYISGTLDDMTPLVPTEDMEIELVDEDPGDMSNSDIVQAIRSQTYMAIKAKRQLLVKVAGEDLTIWGKDL